MATVTDLTSQLIDLNRQMSATPEKRLSTVTARDQYGRVQEVTHTTVGMSDLMDQADDLCDQLEAQLPEATPAEAAKAGYAAIDFTTIVTRYAESEYAKAALPGKASLTNGRWDQLAGMVVTLEEYGYRTHN